MEGEKITYTYKIIQSNFSVKYTGIEIKELLTNTTIALKDNLDIDVTAKKNATISLSGLIPFNILSNNSLENNKSSSNSNQSMRTYPCFKFYIQDLNGNSISKELYSCSEDTTKINFYTLKQLQCKINSDCPLIFSCNSNEGKCTKITCNECEYVKNQVCTPYECCSSNACQENEACLDNTCKVLTCNQDELLESHECLKLVCKDDEYIFEQACRTLICQNDEKIINHTCEKVVCEENQEIKNGECIKLNCALGKVPTNHKCEDFKCGFFQIAEHNSCTFNYRLLLKILVALGLIFGIGGFLYKKYKEQHQIPINSFPPIN